MKHRRDPSEASKDISLGRYIWRHDDIGGGEEAYSVCDPDGWKVAAIFADDISKPIDARNNTKLATREFGSEDFELETDLDFRDALLRGNMHIEKYRHSWTVQSIMDSIPTNGPRFRPFINHDADYER